MLAHIETELKENTAQRIDLTTEAQAESEMFMLLNWLAIASSFVASQQLLLPLAKPQNVSGAFDATGYPALANITRINTTSNGFKLIKRNREERIKHKDKRRTHSNPCTRAKNSNWVGGK